MKCGILFKKSQNYGSSKHWIVTQGAWITWSRDASTFRKLYDKVKHLKNCKFYTDDWDTVLPKDRHIMGKKGTERDNSNTRHHLTRRAKIVSKKEAMVNGSIKLWCALTDPAIFRQYQKTFSSIFR